MNLAHDPIFHLADVFSCTFTATWLHVFLVAPLFAVSVMQQEPDVLSRFKVEGSEDVPQVDRTPKRYVKFGVSEFFNDIGAVTQKRRNSIECPL